jgi:hypothetical protein
MRLIPRAILVIIRGAYVEPSGAFISLMGFVPPRSGSWPRGKTRAPSADDRLLQLQVHLLGL